MDHEDILKITQDLISETEKIIIGKRFKIELMIMAIFSEGHILINDMPGVGKTTLVKALSIALGCRSSRVQFTPDLLPSDIIGMKIFNQKTGDFEIVHGPVMTNILLADEINRAIPRTQSALLEAMEERQVTIDSETYKIAPPFIVMATQNPVEAESTFSLPVAQMDRFLIRISMGYPSVEEEMTMLDKVGDEIPFHTVTPILSQEKLSQISDEIRNIYIDEKVRKYIVSIVDATRGSELLKAGASPRGSRALFRASKAWAAMHGKAFVTPEDIKTLAPYVLAHRIVPGAEARLSGRTAEEIIKDILDATPVPPTAEEILYDRRV